nr:metallophosphoesterase [Synechococcus sp. CCY 9618]
MAIGAWAGHALGRGMGPAAPVGGPPVGPAGLAAPPRGDVRLVAISDLNSAYGSTSYLSQVTRGITLIPGWQPDLVLCGGDMIAGQKRGLGRERLQAMWAGFDTRILQPLRRAGLPVVVTMGNHDASGSRARGQYAFPLDREEARRFWQARRDRLGLRLLDATAFPFAYSLRQNDLFLLVWDASSATVPAEQVAWAERALASPEARSARERFVLGHLPLYPVGRGREGGGNVLVQADRLRQLMERHNVRAYISGHHHAYFPGRVGSLDLIALGALGSGPRTWLGQTAAPLQTLTVIDLFDGAPAPVLTTYDMNSLRPIPLTALPPRIVSPSGVVVARQGG